MGTETVTLTGDAVRGIPVQDGGYFPPALRAHPLPAQVKLGRIAPKARPQVLRLGAYFDPAKMATPLPVSISRREKAAASLARMYANDRYGCCVFSSVAHRIGLWSAVDSDSGGEVQAADKEVVDQYFAYTGGRDQGAIIYEVLDYMRTKGFLAGGRRHKIDGYVSVDWTNKELVKAAQFIFGASCIGIDLPSAWTSSAVWDVTNTRSVGGHDVAPIDYDEKGVYVSSWGRIYLMTWAAFLSKRWVGEYYASLAPLWYGPDKQASAHGIDVETLLADLKKLDDGEVPPIEPPPPPPPPPPPDHVGYTTTVYTHVPPVWTPVQAQDAGLPAEFRGKITPEQWAAIIAILMELFKK
jgi:hypothetical protein